MLSPLINNSKNKRTSAWRAAVYSCIRERLNTALFGTETFHSFAQRMRSPPLRTASTPRSIIELNVGLQPVVVVLVVDVGTALVQEIAEPKHEPLAEAVVELDDMTGSVGTTSAPIRIRERADDGIRLEILIRITYAPGAGPSHLAQASADRETDVGLVG